MNVNSRLSGRKIRFIAAGTMALAVGASLIGCAGSGSSTSGMDGKTVKMFTWVGSSDETAQWNAYIAGAKLEDSSVDVKFSGPAIGSYYTKLPTQLTSSDAPCIVTLQNGNVAQVASALEPLDSYAESAKVSLSDYDKSMVSQLSVDGKTYALPYDAEPFVLYYNKKLFQEAGVATPEVNWTTSEFLAAAKATTKDGVYGFAIGQGLGGVQVFAAANDENFIKDGKFDFADPNLAKRFQFVVDLATKEKVASPLEASGGTFPDIDQFGSGKAAMFINGTWDLTHEQATIGKDNLGVATIPVDSGSSHGSINGTGFAMTKTCSDKPAAFKAIAAMTSAKSQQSVAESRTQVPARADSLASWKTSAGDEAAAVVQALTANGQVSGAYTNQTQIGTLFTKFETDAFSGKSTVDEVLKQVQTGSGQ